MEGGWFDQEAIEQERLDADMLQAQYESEGMEFGRRLRKAQQLFEQGKFAEAAEWCPHGGGYPLNSPAAENDGDPMAGTDPDAWRRMDCGSRMKGHDPLVDMTVIVPCELFLVQ